MKNILTIGIVAAVFYFVSRMRFKSLAQFTIKGVSLSGKSLNVVVNVQNPTGANINLKGLSGKLFANNEYIANVNSFDPVLIKGNNQTDMVLNFIPSALGVFSTLKTFFTDAINIRRKPIVFKFDGSANIDGFTIPFITDYQF